MGRLSAIPILQQGPRGKARKYRIPEIDFRIEDWASLDTRNSMSFSALSRLGACFAITMPDTLTCVPRSCTSGENNAQGPRPFFLLGLFVVGLHYAHIIGIADCDIAGPGINRRICARSFPEGFSEKFFFSPFQPLRNAGSPRCASWLANNAFLKGMWRCACKCAP
ncbi:MAG: hypothetical protein CM15mP21_5580 [Hyphomicrobiales bacterium]|nr:MAG: hypothetical protein CM15mP21_5580 [Hyphomicrobiales bacterium]